MPLTTEIRRLNKQHVRKALIDLTLPVRSLPLPVARPLGPPSEYADVSFRLRESGQYEPVTVDFGDIMPDRSFDQETTVFTIDAGKCSFRNNHALDGQRRVMYQQDLPFGHLPIALAKLDEPVEHFDSVAYLSNTWVTNYYHWLMLVLPMLRFYDLAGLEAEKFYVGEPLKEWQARTLDYAGVSHDRIVVDPCTADVGHVAMLTRHTTGIPPEQVKWARSVFVKEEPQPGTRRLFVGRGEVVTRKMIGEHELAEALEKHFGFEYVVTNELSFDDEIELFGQAGAVVAPYGAAITNTLFSPVGTKILELTAFDHDFRLAHCYQEMSAAIGHRHASLRGEKTPRRKNGAYSDIKMSIDDVLRHVEDMLSST